MGIPHAHGGHRSSPISDVLSLQGRTPPHAPCFAVRGCHEVAEGEGDLGSGLEGWVTALASPNPATSMSLGNRGSEINEVLSRGAGNAQMRAMKGFYGI